MWPFEPLRPYHIAGFDMPYVSDDSEVIYIADLARMYGKTEASIREGIRRGVEWLPKGTKIAGKHAWLREDVRKFLREYVDGQHRKAKPGRKRQAPPMLSFAKVKTVSDTGQ